MKSGYLSTKIPDFATKVHVLVTILSGDAPNPELMCSAQAALPCLTAMATGVSAAAHAAT